MKLFESRLARATDPNNRELLGAAGLVVDKEGTILYHHAAGHQTLDPDSPPLDPDCTMELGSAGKFITNIAALQCVEKGLITLDEPVYSILPELETLPLISKNPNPGPSDKSYILTPATKKITLRTLLLHTSGISHSGEPLIQAWQADQPEKPVGEASLIVRYFSLPLIFEPGEGYSWGASIYWTDLLLARLTNQGVAVCNVEQVFKPLGLTSSTYHPDREPDICSRLLQMVERDGDSLVPAKRVPQGLVSSASDIGKVLADLISTSPKLLSKENLDLFFTGQFDSSSALLAQFRDDPDNYAIPAGVPETMTTHPVNWGAAGLVVDGELPLSKFPPGTTTWNGMPNVIWAMNRDRGLGMVFVTQVLPIFDEKAISLAMSFFREAWERFGRF